MRIRVHDLTITKLVTYAGDEEELQRNQYRFRRAQ